MPFMVRWEPDAKLHESGREFLFGTVLGEAARPPGAAPGSSGIALPLRTEIILV